MSIQQWFVIVAFLFISGMGGMIIGLVTQRRGWRRFAVATVIGAVIGLIGVAASTSFAVSS